MDVSRLARRLRQEAGVELSPSQTAALATIERHGPLTPSELAARERVQRPTVTRVVARLCDAGLVERLPDERDRRAALLSITPAGRNALRDLRRQKTAYLAERLSELRPEERALLARASGLLERMLDDEP